MRISDWSSDVCSSDLLDLDGGAPRVILDNVPMPNAFEVGPDGKLYIPVMGTNEIWRVSLDGGAPEVVARDLGVPDSVKFDAQGRIVSTQVHSGQVLRVDPGTGDKTLLAQLKIGRAHVGTPVPNAHLVCRLMMEK